MKCGNIECEKETNGIKKYCSYSCRSTYINKYVKNYDKNIETNNKKRDIREIKYLESPKICDCCKQIIPFNKKRNKYCSYSCSAITSNKNRIKNGFKVIHSEKSKNKISEANINFAKEKANLNNVEYKSYSKKMCKNCNTPCGRNIFCSKTCHHIFVYSYMESFNLYKKFTKFIFAINNFDDYFETDLISKYGWYKAANRGNNLNGVSRDHIYSIRIGYNNNINPLLLAHPANCKLILQKNNSKKHSKCDITIDELLEKIKIFDNKYGKYYINDIPTYITTYDILKEPIFISYTEKNEKIQPKI